ncbi:hypothetical protein STAS_18835 [Striga asiatica]|uniref:Uncharacterized protein n=1 Tax=Striga asiatica TaxID=4170 RepID=A0A5A7QAT3_STRAF|nr:hypothetical protein STAS_18835 [Striga asiatica]
MPQPWFFSAVAAPHPPAISEDGRLLLKSNTEINHLSHSSFTADPTLLAHQRHSPIAAASQRSPPLAVAGIYHCMNRTNMDSQDPSISAGSSAPSTRAAHDRHLIRRLMPLAAARICH